MFTVDVKQQCNNNNQAWKENLDALFCGTCLSMVPYRYTVFCLSFTDAAFDDCSVSEIQISKSIEDNSKIIFLFFQQKHRVRIFVVISFNTQ